MIIPSLFNHKKIADVAKTFKSSKTTDPNAAQIKTVSSSALIE